MPRTPMRASEISSSVPFRNSSVESSPETKCSASEITAPVSNFCHSSTDSRNYNVRYSAFLVLRPTPLSSDNSALVTIIGVGNPAFGSRHSPLPNPKCALNRLPIALAAIQDTCWLMMKVTRVLNGSIASSDGSKGRQGTWANIPEKRGSMEIRCEMAMGREKETVAGTRSGAASPESMSDRVGTDGAGPDRGEVRATSRCSVL